MEVERSGAYDKVSRGSGNGKMGAVNLHRAQRKKDGRMSIWIFILIIVGWVVLQAYILPKFGIST